MLFSIIIPTHNRAKLLAEAVLSIRENTIHDHEIIVIDDASTDGTGAYLEGQGNLRWKTGSGLGPARARNLGASMAGGDYLVFLDSDDLLFPWSLATYAQLIEETNASFITGKPFVFHNDKRDHFPAETERAHQAFTDYLNSGDEWRWWGCSSFVIRREAFTRAKGFVDQWINYEDADLALRLGTAPGFVQVTSPHTFAYRRHEVSEMKQSGRALAGAVHLLESMLSGSYPGFPKRKHEQWRIVSRHLRSFALKASSPEERRFAWRFYRSSFPYHVKTGRVRFLGGFLLTRIKRFTSVS